MMSFFEQQMLEIAIVALLNREGRPRTLTYIARHLGKGWYYDLLPATRRLEKLGLIWTHHSSDAPYCRAGAGQRLATLIPPPEGELE